MNSISLTIPLTRSALTRAMNMLQGLSVDLLDENIASVVSDSDAGAPETTTTPATPPSTDNVTPISSRGKAAGSNTTTPPPVITDVELDAEGLPWDARIHGKTKTKLKKEKTWKKIKNIEKNKPGLVEQVEAELRTSMAANPVTPPPVNDPPLSTTVTPTPPPVNEQPPSTPPAPVVEKLYLIDGKQFTADALRAANWTELQIAQLPEVEATLETPPPTPGITFPEFMAKTTAALANGTLTQVAIDTALNAQGLASMPLLAARPDLVATIHSVLFPNG